MSAKIDYNKIIENLNTFPRPDDLSYFRSQENRTEWIVGEVGDNCYDIVDDIIRWNREDKEANISPKKRDPIKIIISSPGGYIERARTLCSIMDLSKTPVWTIGIGPVSSAASMIYVCGHKRLITPNVTFLLHEGSVAGVEGTFEEIQAFAEQYQRDIEEMKEIYRNHTQIPEKMFDTEFRGDWYITLKEAKKYGLYDEVVKNIDILL